MWRQELVVVAELEYSTPARVIASLRSEFRSPLKRPSSKAQRGSQSLCLEVKDTKRDGAAPAATTTQTEDPRAASAAPLLN
jgi:hypothetical protein